MTMHDLIRDLRETNDTKINWMTYMILEDNATKLIAALG